MAKTILSFKNIGAKRRALSGVTLKYQDNDHTSVIIPNCGLDHIPMMVRFMQADPDTFMNFRTFDDDGTEILRMQNSKRKLSWLTKTGRVTEDIMSADPDDIERRVRADA